MPGKRRILPIAISTLLLAPGVKAAPQWDCRPNPAGGWDCFKEGVLVAPEPAATVTAPAPAREAPAAVEAEQPSTIPEQQPASLQEQAPQAPPPEPEVVSTPAEPAAPAGQPVPEAEPRVEAPAEAAAPVERQVQQAGPEPEAEPAQVTHQATPGPTAAEQPAEPVEEERTAADTTTPEPEPAPVLPVPTEGVARLDQGLNWEQCSPDKGFDVPPLSPLPDNLTHASADGLEFQRDNEIAILTGDVVMREGDQLVEAQRISYDKTSDTLQADKGIYFEQPGLRIAGSKATLQLEEHSGEIENLEYRLLDKTARGSASSVQILDSDRSHFQQANYTTCRPGNSDWLLQAAELNVDKASGVGTAKDAKLTFKGVPLFYMPTITFPVDDRRKSGLLIPSVGISDKTGLDIEIPYYFNIAPNMDATLTPRIMTERGIMLGGEFRYLQPTHQGVLKAELLPSDSEAAPGVDENRGSLSFKAHGAPAPRWHFDLDYNQVSDDDYFDDFGQSLAVSSATTQERRGDIRYNGEGWSARLRLHDYQIVGDGAKPYAKLPQLLVELNRPNQAYGLTYHLRAEYVYFDKSDAVHGSRVDLHPGVSLPIRRPWGYLTPKLSLRHTSYSLEEQTAGLSDSPDRTLPTLSLDGGLFYERSTSWFGSATTQTLEPRLFYLYTSDDDQSSLPNFDTSEYGFSFQNLFRENRFSGSDRVGDANQLTLALTSRQISDLSGEELFRASIGQIYYFRDREVQISGATQTDDSSALVAEVAAKLGDDWRARAGLQWNPHDDDDPVEKSAVSLHYNDNRERIFNFAYRFDDNLLEHTDISARWPMSSNTHLVGRWNYSLRDNATMEAFGGIEYDSCCWNTRLVLRQHRTSATVEPDLGIFLQLELKGLTSFGDRIDDFLERGILGYQADNE
ncbi:MAG: LPS assembly protein LptD [Sedimenticola sp.]